MVKKFTVKGLVQGIGYRPFVARKAKEFNIKGWVRNTGGIVTVLAAGEDGQIKDFCHMLEKEVPSGGFVREVIMEDADEEQPDGTYEPGFRIIASDSDDTNTLPFIPPDIATCDDCQRELFDSDNRRYRHPFISCTLCGPRYSILKKLPYDRDAITMADFLICVDCKNEYINREDRRCHAQTIACHNCGPEMSFEMVKGDMPKGDGPISRAISHIKSGGILAIKDIGGYHLACDPFQADTVLALRKLKHRESKPLAVMFSDMEEAGKYCHINEIERQLLKSPARPIVLLKARRKLPYEVCLNSPDIGAMLGCNPVQLLLLKECPALVMTSGNASGDVLETDDGKMSAWLHKRVKEADLGDAPIAMLSHNRQILRPQDDSVMKVVAGRQQFIRRGRGHVPMPVFTDIRGEIFAAGGDLKSAFCYVKNGYAYVSQHLGDMESVSCQKFYLKEKAAMKDIFGFKPGLSVCDKHPGYFSTGLAEAAVKVQHHKAHVASVIAEHRIKGRVLGFAFDGTGYGDDGGVWGSEVFLWDGEAAMERVAHLKPVKILGGDEAARNCDTVLAAMLHHYGIDYDMLGENAAIIRAAIDNNINTVSSTSMGRLFDAMSSLLGICHYNSYEGQAPVELENVAAATDEAYELAISDDGDVGHLLSDAISAMDNGISIPAIARGFIYAVADFILRTATANAPRLDDKRQIVLSGGTFLNRVLLEKVVELLEEKGFGVYFANELPAGDGGLCLGQAYLAGRINKRG